MQSPNAKIYLFGTMHLLPKQGDWFGPKIAAAFADSQEVWEEADVGLASSGAAMNIMGRAVDPAGDLWSKLPPATAVKFRDQLKSCHLPPGVVQHFRPWFATMLPTICQLTEQSGAHLVGGMGGPEGTFITKAKAANKPVKFFETAEEQIGYLANAPEAVQLKQLREAIDTAGAGREDFAGMETAWISGDVAGITKLVQQTQGEDKAFYATIFTNRNTRFAARIAELLRGHTNAFIAIGAGHLAGPDSVQAQLEKFDVSSKRL